MGLPPMLNNRFRVAPSSLPWSGVPDMRHTSPDSLGTDDATSTANPLSKVLTSELHETPGLGLRDHGAASMC